MDFLQQIHRNLTGTDPRPLVYEVEASGTIRELDRPAYAALLARVRGGLRAQHVHAGDRVVLLGSNSILWTAIDLAILYEGAICVPMYARQAPHELVAMMADAAPVLVAVEDAELWHAIHALWPDAPLVDFATLAAGTPAAGGPRAHDPQDLATIVYTSGTSGEAKGVQISMANADGMLGITTRALVEHMGEEAGAERVFHYLPCCFMGSRVLMWTCLFREIPLLLSTRIEDVADELRIASPHYLLNVPILLERVRAGAEAAIASGPAIGQLAYRRASAAWQRRKVGAPARWLDDAALRFCEQRIFVRIRERFGPDLRFLICGSAPLAPSTQDWFEMIGIPVYQVYGLTETTAIVTMDRPGLSRPGTVGFVVDGCEGRVSPEGELQVRGPNVFAGYWDRPEATREAFDGEWFRTGDLVELDEDGRLRVIGRLKHLLVLSSGHNVAPEPLEDALRAALPAAAQVVVVGHGRPSLAVVFTGPVTQAAARRAADEVSASLPHYKRIRAVHVQPEPFTEDSGLLTANGKLRRAAIEDALADTIEALYA